MSRSLRDALGTAHRLLADAGLPSPSADAQALAAHVLGVSKAELARRIVLGDHLDAGQEARFDQLIQRRSQRFPLQHLTGTAGFRRLNLLVGQGVFVPRAETELVAGIAIDAALALVEDGEPPVVVDLCTGSGAIALAVADEVPQARVVAVELDPPAVAWAHRNVKAHQLCDRVEIRAGDAARADTTVLADLAGAVDIVTANPPYIPPDAEPAEPEVRDHDPALALYGGGDDGLATVRAVIAAAAGLLKPGGLFVMEHGDLQGQATRAVITGPVWEPATTERDLAGRDRALVARRSR